MDLKHRILRESFGYAEFRPGQQQLIDAMLAGRDVLAILPTGAGKSICYQIAGLLLPGVTLVVSPLVSLMQDQVAALRRAGVSACFINSTQSQTERNRTLRFAAQGRCKLIYAAPERLTAPDFMELFLRLPISMLAVDEAHCISQWGHDFRPDYRKIPRFIAALPARPILSAFTATATRQVREDIVNALSLRDPLRMVTSFDRPNLHYAVQRGGSRESEMLAFVQAQAGGSGIVYCLTRRKTETLARYLRDNDIPAVAYHAGLPAETRRQAQEQFVSGETPVIVATNAFGMGINKPDVRFVVHFGMPADLESYYQQAGRAGRDGAPAQCLLLFAESDISKHQFFIRKEPENTTLDEAELEQLRAGKQKRLEQMKRYAFSRTCLRQSILRYFGQKASDFCGSCGCCDAASREMDITLEAQKVLSCVYRMQEQADAALLARVLRGESAPEIARAGYDALSTYGILRERSREDVQKIIARLLQLGYLREEDARLRLRACAGDVLFHGQRVAMRVPVSAVEARLRHMSLSLSRPELARQLEDYRRRTAIRRGVPEQMILSDQALRRLVRAMPRDTQELRDALGTNDALALRGAKGALPVIVNYLKNFSETDAISKKI